MKRRQTRDPIGEAARIIHDATEVDWSREPLTEYEDAIRTEYLSRALLTFDGRAEILHLSFTHSECVGSDLEAAADEALHIIEERVAGYHRAALAEARRAVDARQPPK